MTCCVLNYFLFFKQKTAYEMHISDWSSDVRSSDLPQHAGAMRELQHGEHLRFMAVHAAGREQAHDVQGAAGLHRLAGAAQPSVVEEAAVLDRRVDPGQVLVDDAEIGRAHV